MKGTTNYTEPSILEGLKIINDCNKKGWFLPDVNAISSDDGYMSFYATQSAMTIAGDWVISNVKEMKDEVHLVVFPTKYENIPPKALGGVNSGWFISGNHSKLPNNRQVPICVWRLEME